MSFILGYASRGFIKGSHAKKFDFHIKKAASAAFY
jgi:hypothetical protein